MKKNLPLQSQLLGKQGEDYAASYLIQQGYRILDRNFRIHYGELDIIAIDKNMLVFVEVKTRTDDIYGSPEEAVTPWKLRELIKVSQWYRLQHKGLPDLERIDVIALKINHNGIVDYCNHIKNVTG